MRVMRYAVVAVLSSAAAACATGSVSDLQVADWKGHPQSELIRAWGTPHRDQTRADGTRTISYLFVNSAMVAPKQQTLSRSRQCTVSFSVGLDGVIDDVTTSGENCRIGPHGDLHPPVRTS